MKISDLNPAELTQELAHHLGYTETHDLPPFGIDLAVDLFEKYGVEIRSYKDSHHKTIIYATMESGGKWYTCEGDCFKDAVFKAFIMSRRPEHILTH